MPPYHFFEALAVILALIYSAVWLWPKYGAQQWEFPIGASLVVGLGALFARWGDLLFYHPELPFFAHWLDFKHLGSCSTGALLGGLTGIVVYCAILKRSLVVVTAIAAEAAGAVWWIGRIGCALVHDHLGAPTTFFLGAHLANGEVRHDIGLYECLYLAVFVAPWVWRRRNAAPDPRGAIAGVAMRWAPGRFLLDFLRVNEVRYAGLTPAQIACLAIALWLVVTRFESSVRYANLWKNGEIGDGGTS